ncbi:MAG: fused MFS/spermidine synthase [Candidatus Omnitrophota bacterium]
MSNSNDLALELDKGKGNPNKKWIQFFVFGLFFFSGISGLIYQIIWTRMLALIFGNTMLATSTVLSAYMAGLAAGSYLAGKYIDKKPRPLVRIYALLEAGIGIFALIFPFLLKAFTPLYTALYHGLEGNFLILNLTRFTVCFILILIPTFLMGATLPVLVKRFVRGTHSIGHELGILYALNTAGAVAGSIACGFFLLKILGMQGTTRIGVIINLAVGIAAWFIGKIDKPVSAAETPADIPVQPQTHEQEFSQGTVNAVLIGTALSGFCALAYELLWTRMLNLFFHNTLHSFTLILATFLTGIAVGSYIYSTFLSKIKNKIRLFIILEAGIGVIAYITPFVFTSLYDILFSKYSEFLTVIKAAVVMVGPTLMMGMALPLAVQICQRGPKHEGNSVGGVYAVNTVGSILGSFGAGFIFIPLLGIHKSVILVAGLNMLGGVLAFLTLVRVRRRPVYATAFIVLMALLFLGASIPIFKNLYQRNQPSAEILSYKEGKIANVVVYDFFKDGYKDFYLNGIEEASSRLWHVQLFKMLGILPTVIHPQADDALMVAFGAGMSAGACAQQVKEFEVADLNPDIYAVGELFAHENLDVLHNPVFRLRVNDGRNQVLLSSKKYSLIISDATNPLTFDSWPLYTREFYETCKNRLKPGGIFCQWVPIPLPDESIKIILRTFKDVYPHTSFWVIYGSSQCLMLGTPERLRIDYKDLSQRLNRIYQSSGLAEFGIDSVEKFLSFFMIGEDKLNEMFRGYNKINTDDLPQAHFNSTLNPEGFQSCMDLLKYQESIFPYLTNMGGEEKRIKQTLQDYVPLSQLLTRGFLSSNQLEYEKAALYADAKNFKDDKNVSCMLKYDYKRKDYFLKRVKQHPEESSAHYNLGFIYSKENNLPMAVEEYKKAISLKPDFAKAYADLANAYIDLGKYDLAEEKLLALKEMNPTGDVIYLVESKLTIIHILNKIQYQPKDPSLHFMLGRAYFEGGEVVKSVEPLRVASELQPNNIEILNLLANIYENLELMDKALDTYRKIAALSPQDPSIQQKINDVYLVITDPEARLQWLSSKINVSKSESAQEDHPADCKRALEVWATYKFDGKIDKDKLIEAAQRFENVIKNHKDHMHAYSDAAAIYEALGNYRKAAIMWNKGLKVNPGNEKATNNIARLLRLEAVNNPTISDFKKAASYVDIGLLHWNNGELELAIKYFKKALTFDPKNSTALANLGVAYDDSGKYKEAVDTLEQSLKINPNSEFRDQINERLQRLHSIIDKRQ